MYIKEIRLQNFQSYYGTDNTLEFTEGLNIVVGSINKGKSKLFDAFYWVLFGEIFITGDKWINTNNLPQRASFINDRARFLAEPGDAVEVTVELVLCRQEGNEQPIDYTICRTVSATRRTDTTTEWYEDHAWHVSSSRAEMRYADGVNTRITETQLEVDLKLQRFFPREIRNYVWFQGEALDKLFDFSDRGSFELAIKYISYFPRYKELSDIMDKASTIIDREYTKKARGLASDKKHFEDRERDLDRKKEELRTLKRELAKAETTCDEAGKLRDEAKEKLDALHEFPPLEKELARAEANLKIAVEQINVAIEGQKTQFQKTWLLKGMEDLMEEAKRRMLDYGAQRDSNAKYVLPAEVPAKVFMEKMLAEEQCLICGTDAPVGSTPHMHIQQRISNQEDHYKQFKDNQELYSSVQQLLEFPDQVIGRISGFNDQIVSTEESIEESVKKRREANEAVMDTKAKITSLIGKYKVSLSEGSTQSKTLTNKLMAMGQLVAETGISIEKKRVAIGRLEEEIKKAQQELMPVNKNGTAIIPEKRWAELADFMKGIVKQVENRAKTDMIRKIENRANEQYAKITTHNKAVWGQIAISPATYKVERVISGTGNETYQAQAMATSSYTLMKMCIINAMLNLNEEFTGTAYPFIADAPTANLDDETTIAYLKSVAPSFGQSIIITKDISQFRFAEVKDDSSVKTIHQLETHSKNLYAEQLTQYEAYTKIKRIK